MFVLGHSAPQGVRRWNPAAGTVFMVASVSRTYGIPGSWSKEALELSSAGQTVAPSLMRLHSYPDLPRME